MDTKLGGFCVFKEHQGSWSKDVWRRVRNEITEVGFGGGSYQQAFDQIPSETVIRGF